MARLTKKIKSPLIFAHVRAAYPGIPTTQDNTHPFTFSRYLFMHNGTIGGWKQIRFVYTALLQKNWSHLELKLES